MFLELCNIWPEADVYTTVYDEEGTEGRFADRRVHTSFLQRLRPTASTFRALLPLYPAAIESLDLSEYDLVVSSSSAWAHAVICGEGSVHVSYCYNPFRYAWNDRDRTLATRHDPVTRTFLRGIFRRWRQWDWIAAQRTDRYVAISRTTQARIRAYFGRESNVVYPPVDTERFHRAAVGDHYALVSELMPHKQIEDAIKAFNALRRPLVVVGDGPDARRLRRAAGPTITFTGRIADAQVAEILQSARALVVTAIEEFGMVAVEAQAAGRPVVARRGGGALETVVDGVTGCFWSGDSDDLVEAILGFDDGAVDPQSCIRNAARFNRASFRQAIQAEVDLAIADDRLPVRDRQPRAATRLLKRAAREANH